MNRSKELLIPVKDSKVLLHSCCAPCSGSIMESLSSAGIDYTVFFYNPNIHPVEEYELRKNENIAFAKKCGDSDEWFLRAKGMEHEPERGRRCTMCFDMRLERAALYAHENGFRVFATSLGISRWKDMATVNDCGRRIAANYSDLTFWDYNWRKNGGSARMIEINRNEGFYQQEYCGCVYSLRDANAYRKLQGRETIKIGTNFYGAE